MVRAGACNISIESKWECLTWAESRKHLSSNLSSWDMTRTVSRRVKPTLVNCTWVGICIFLFIPCSLPPPFIYCNANNKINRIAVAQVIKLTKLCQSSHTCLESDYSVSHILKSFTHGTSFNFYNNPLGIYYCCYRCEENKTQRS